MVGSTGAGAITFRRLTRGMRQKGTYTENGNHSEEDNHKKQANKFEYAGVKGEEVKNLSTKPPSGRKGELDCSAYETQLARGMGIVLHPARATSKPTGE